MRIIICTYLILFLGVLNAQSKSYTPVVQEGAWWIYGENWGDSGQVVGFSKTLQYFEGDTIIGGIQYKILNNKYIGENQLSTPYYCGFFREMDKIVYEYTPEGEKVLYDFNLLVGDTFQTSFIEYDNNLYLLQFNIIEILFKELKDGSTVRQFLHNSNNHQKEFAEGIGSFSGFLKYPYGSQQTYLDYNFWTTAYGIDQQVLWGGSYWEPDASFNELIEIMLSTESTYNKQTKLSPNPTSHSLNIQSKTAVKQSIIYNINGQKVLQTDATTQLNVSALKPGRYIAQIQLIDSTISSQHFVKQ